MDIQFPQILFQIINFGVVAGALTYLLYKPVRKMLQERSDRIEEAQKAAEVTIAEKRQIEELKKKTHRDAEKEAAKILDEATQEAATKRHEVLAQAKKEAMVEIAKMKEEWEQERAASLQSMSGQFADAVIEAVKKLVGEALDKKTHAKIIDNELNLLLKRI